MTRPSLWIYLHIRKTGGNTFYKEILRKNLTSQELYYIMHRDPGFALSQDMQEKARVLVDHTNFGIHRLIERPAKYMTIIRDPIKRTISNYLFTWSHTGHAYHADVTENKMSLRDYMHSGIDKTVDNGITRAIAGDISNEFGYGKCTERLLHQALENIEKHFWGIGVLKHYDWAVYQMARVMNLSKCFYYKRNVGKPKDAMAAIPGFTEEDMKAVRQYNELDMKLFEFVEKRIEKQMACASLRERFEIKLFLLSNRIYHTMYGTVKNARDRFFPLVNRTSLRKLWGPAK